MPENSPELADKPVVVDKRDETIGVMSSAIADLTAAVVANDSAIQNEVAALRKARAANDVSDEKAAIANISALSTSIHVQAVGTSDRVIPKVVG
jgi:hypothetical protein